VLDRVLGGRKAARVISRCSWLTFVLAAAGACACTANNVARSAAPAPAPATSPAPAPAAGGALLAVGAAAPDVTLADQDGKVRRLAGWRDGYVVLWFYPRDFTSGCTIEAQAFRSDYAKYKDLGAEIVGVSTDTSESHKGFCAKEALPFSLLADTEHKMAAAFGVPVTGGAVKRATFIIDRDGVVRAVWPKVKVIGHSAEVLAALGALTAQGASSAAPARADAAGRP